MHWLLEEARMELRPDNRARRRKARRYGRGAHARVRMHGDGAIIGSVMTLALLGVVALMMLLLGS